MENNRWLIASVEFRGRKRIDKQYIHTDGCFEDIEAQCLAEGHEKTCYLWEYDEWPNIKKTGWKLSASHKFFAVVPGPYIGRETVWRNKRERARSRLANWREPETAGLLSDLPDILGNRIKPGLNDCWIWTGGGSLGGYGRSKYKGKRWPAHRLIYTLLKTEIPKHAVLLHSCDNRICVNPLHLSVGTVYENNHDAASKGRNPFFEKDKTVWKRRNKGKLGRTPYWEDLEPTTQQICQIRIRYHTGQNTIHKLANEYGFSRVTVSRIVNYQMPITQKKWCR